MSRRLASGKPQSSGQRLKEVLAVGQALREHTQDVGVAPHTPSHTRRELAYMGPHLMRELINMLTERTPMSAFFRARMLMHMVAAGWRNLLLDVIWVRGRTLRDTVIDYDVFDTITQNLQYIISTATTHRKNTAATTAATITDQGRTVAIGWLRESLYGNKGEIMLFLPKEYKEDKDLCRRMVLLYPRFAFAISGLLKMDPVIRLIVYHGTGEKADDAMHMRDMDLDDLKAALDKEDSMFNDDEEWTHTGWTSQQVLNWWHLAQGVVDISILINDFESVKRAVTYHGAVLQSMSIDLQSNIELRLLASKTAINIALWVLKDLARDFLEPYVVIQETLNGRILPNSPSMEKAADHEIDGSVLELYVNLIGEIVELYPTNKKDLTDAQILERTEILRLAEQIIAVLSSPNGKIFKQILTSRVRGERPGFMS
jgi:hypothetical protein